MLICGKRVVLLLVQACTVQDVVSPYILGKVLYVAQWYFVKC